MKFFCFVLSNRQTIFHKANKKLQEKDPIQQQREHLPGLLLSAPQQRLNAY